MSIKSGQAVTVLFATADATTGAATDATGTPVGTLYVNGTADAAEVTVTKITTGVYKAAGTLPALSAGRLVGLRIAATVSAVAAEGIVWQDAADTKRVSDLNDIAAGALMGLADDAITAAKFDEATAYPLKSADTGATAVARTGADSDTLETLSDELVAMKGATFDTGADSLEALRNRGDSAWVTATGFSTHSAGDVKTAIEAAGSSIAAILEDTGTTLDTLVKDIPTNSELAAAFTEIKGATWAAGTDTLEHIRNKQTDIEADTNELQTDWANGGRLDVILDAATAPSAATVADAVWDEALAEHAGVGTAGAQLTAAGAAGDPWSTALPGDYAAGTAGNIIGSQILAAVAAAEVTVTSPVAEDGSLTIYQGDGYLAAKNRQISFAVVDASHYLILDDATCEVQLRLMQATWIAESVTETEAGYTIVFEPTYADTAALTALRQQYQLRAVYETDGAQTDEATLATGTATLTKEIPEVTA